jgi:hypothetical protein
MREVKYPRNGVKNFRESAPHCANQPQKIEGGISATGTE